VTFEDAKKKKVDLLVVICRSSVIKLESINC